MPKSIYPYTTFYCIFNSMEGKGMVSTWANVHILPEHKHVPFTVLNRLQIPGLPFFKAMPNFAVWRKWRILRGDLMWNTNSSNLVKRKFSNRRFRNFLKINLVFVLGKLMQKIFQIFTIRKHPEYKKMLLAVLKWSIIFKFWNFRILLRCFCFKTTDKLTWYFRKII